MRSRRWGAAAVALVAITGSLTSIGSPTIAGAADASVDPAEAIVDAIPASSGGNGAGKRGSDSPDGPFDQRQRELKQKALERKLSGKSDAQGRVVQVAKGQYVELSKERTERVFVVIAEFGTANHPIAPAIPGRLPGPLHNQIPQPDRSLDNTTLWKADYNKAHYEDMYFNRMEAYYKSQSSGRYSINGDVSEWVRVPFNQARYGSNYCGSIVCPTTWFLIRDAMAFWVQDQLAQGRSMAQINTYLSTFDIWDRYDYNGNGNFDEPDGYIDHFQIVHAGGDEAAGDPQYGTDAIWSHRWYAQVNPAGSGGPSVGGVTVPFGGVQIGQGGLSGGLTIPDNRAALWVGDYTIQPENGGLGVFVHEYGHDLGLPDLYDTSGNTGGAENSTGFWTLMSSGANIGDGGPNGIGDHPTDLGAWEKLQLGWLGCGTCPGGTFYEVAQPGQKSEHKLGPANTATKQAQALVVVLPDKQVQSTIGAPFDGPDFWYSGSADNLDVRMQAPMTLGAAPQLLSAKVRYQIEADWDYAYVVVSTNGGTTWTNVATNLSTGTNPNGQNFGNGITGSTFGNWVTLTADLSAFANQNVLVGFRYWTDGAVVEPGFSVDAVTVNGTPVTSFTFTPATGGFRLTTGVETTAYFNAYVAEFRSYRGYDTSLRTAYNFGFTNSRPDWVEHFPYQDGLLISYWDSSYTDNNVGDHPGAGLVLPVDAHPALQTWANGTLIRPRIQSYDSTFGLDATDPITLHLLGIPSSIPSQPAVSVFDDTKTWWTGGTVPGRYQPGWVGVNPPKTGTTIRVKSISGQGSLMQVSVNK